VSDTDARVPTWGFASSPLVVDDLVIVNTGALAAYDSATGDLRWVGPADEGFSTLNMGYYSSAHLLTIAGIAQILQLSPTGTSGLAPTTGAPLWNHPWSGVVQPAQTADGDVLIGTLGGISRIAAAHGPSGWTVEERWTTRGLKPNFSDFVVHEGHAYGFDGGILASIDVADGTRAWKGGRYGHGQLLLLADQDVLLVLSERGEAVPDQFTEFSRFRAVDGKTWNHPVLVGDVLLVRNDQEMVAFRLSLSAPEKTSVR
jgi:hypothetical protein